MGALAPGSRERVVFELAKRLQDEGAALDLLIPCPDQTLLDQIPTGIEVVDIGWSASRRLPSIARLALAPPRLSAYLRKARPDMALTMSIPPALSMLAAKRLSGGDTAIIIRQSNVIRIKGSARYGHIDRRWRDPLIRRLYSDADAVIAVSKETKDNLHRLTGMDQRRIHHVANGVFLDRIDEQSRAPMPHPWFDDGGSPVIVAVGRLVPKKDYTTLLHALSAMRERRLARLIILGEGRMRPALEREIAKLGLEDAVAMPGRIANPFAYLARASLYVLSSTFEGMPSALIEALACGCPTVSTDCPSGPSEILADGAFGRLVPVGSSSSLAAAMAATLAEPPPRKVQRSRAAAFSASRTIDGYLEVLTKVRQSVASSRRQLDQG